MTGPGRFRTDEQGSAIVEFVLVGMLVLAVCMAIIQVTLALHVRAVLIDSAAEGARYAARSGHDLEQGIMRTEELIRSALPDSYARDVRAQYTSGAGRDLVTVDVGAPVPLFGMLGPSAVEVSGRAVAE